VAELQLRQLDATRAIKMIALTGHGLAEDQQRVLAGCTARDSAPD